jgi:hypothetical protein
MYPHGPLSSIYGPLTENVKSDPLRFQLLLHGQMIAQGAQMRMCWHSSGDQSSRPICVEIAGINQVDRKSDAPMHEVN